MFGLTHEGKFVDITENSTESNTPNLIAVVIEIKDVLEPGQVHTINRCLRGAFPLPFHSYLQIEHTRRPLSTLQTKLLQLLGISNRHSLDDRRLVDITWRKMKPRPQHNIA